MRPRFLFFLAVAAVPPGAELPAQTRGDMTARLWVHEDAPPQPGSALVRITLSVTGGQGLEVGPPPLPDPVNAWEIERQEAAATDDGRETWTGTYLLRQTKPGRADLPDVKVQFRDGAYADWQTVEWPAPLKHATGALPPELLPPVTPTPWPLWAGAAAALLLAGAAGCWFGLRRRRPRRPPPPERMALLELDRLDGSADPAAYHTALSDVVRRYLADRFGLPATRQTTAEFLETVRRSGRLSAEQQSLLRDFLGRCDLAKFAPVGASAEECRQAAGLARTLVEQTSGTKAVVALR